MSDQIFLSYSHTDAATADEIGKVLEDLSVSFFRDVKDIGWGDSITSKVEDAISDCAAILVIVSPGSLKSHWVPYEIGRASALDKKILPYLTHPALDVPHFIRDLSYAVSLEHVRDFFSRNPELIPKKVATSQSFENAPRIIDREIQGAAWQMGSFFAAFETLSIQRKGAVEQGMHETIDWLTNQLGVIADSIATTATAAKIIVSSDPNKLHDSYHLAVEAWPLPIRNTTYIAFHLTLAFFYVHLVSLAKQEPDNSTFDRINELRGELESALLPVTFLDDFHDFWEEVYESSRKGLTNEEYGTKTDSRFWGLIRKKRDEIEAM